jgi:hypothetical protein
LQFHSPLLAPPPLSLSYTARQAGNEFKFGLFSPAMYVAFCLSI